MGDQNAPERLYGGYVRPDLYDRAITERDEAEKALLDSAEVASGLLDEHNKARAQADRYREGLDAAEAELMNAMRTPFQRIAAASESIRAALAEGEQPAGESKTFWLCLACNIYAELAWWKQDGDRATCPCCLHVHTDDSSNSGVFEGTEAEVVAELQRLGFNPAVQTFRPAAGVQSTTETATHHEYSLIDAVLPADGPDVERRIAAMVNALPDWADHKGLDQATRDMAAAYAALRREVSWAAAPATPEGPER